MRTSAVRSPAGARVGRARSVLLVAALLILIPAVAARAQTGKIVGRVLDDKTGKPLPYTNVSLLGTTTGTIAREDGSFVLSGVAPGKYEVQASFMGYESKKVEVTVQDLRTSEMEIRLKETVAAKVKEVVVTAERPLVEVDRGATIHTVTGDQIKQLTIDPTLESVVEQQPGVTRDRGRIHIRGGRSDETLYIVDGVQMRDILSGESGGGSAVSARSVAEVNVITGGFDAKYGQALSGIIEAKTKEGTQDYHGSLSYETDRLTDNWDTDLVDLQLSGPVPLFADILRPLSGEGSGPVTFALDLATDLNNGYLPSIADTHGSLESSYRDHVFGDSFRYQRFFYPRADNDWRGLLKTTWKASPAHKFSFSWSKNLTFNQGFNDTDISQVNRNINNYPWAWAHRLDRYYTVSKDQNSFSLTWNNTLKPSLLQQVKLTRYFSARHQDVAGQNWNTYDRSLDASLPPNQDDPFFIDTGDASSYSDRYIETWGVDWGWTHHWREHRFEWGLHSQYEDVQYLSLNAASIDTTIPGDLGDEFDLFHVYPNTGDFYVQDKLEFEGLVANLGLRYDYWFPGQQVDELYKRADRPTITPETRREYIANTHSFFGYRYKGRISPRLQVSHPITERSHLFFNYGHFSQWPAYFYVYAKSSSQSSEEFPRIGNPNLDPEVSVQYELGAEHQFRDDMAIKVSVYNKDIYDYPTSTTLVLQDRTTTRSNFFIYRNLDYARSRGIELELRKQRVHRISYGATYTFSNAKGKSSDPNNLAVVRESGGDARETALDEEYMWWNRPHKLTAWFNYNIARGDKATAFLGLRLPEDLRLNAYLQIQSGRAYTPQDIFGNQTAVAYSKNGPFDSTVNATLVKGLQAFGTRMELSFQIWNILNYRNAIDFDPVTGKRYKPGQGSLIRPLQDPANLKLSDLDLVRVANVELEINRDDPRFDGLTPGTPDWQAVYDQIRLEEAAQVAPGLRRQIYATISRYSDPSMLAAPRHARVGVSIEW
jgi:outer membrane receptor protein involved in Fe transport